MRRTEPEANIPNIELIERGDQAVSDASLHIDSLYNLSERFGREMPAHRHDRYYQVHYLESGQVWVNLDGQAYSGDGPLFFATPPTVPHSFVFSNEAAGVAITIRQDMFSRMQAGAVDSALTNQFSTPLFMELGALATSLARDAERLGTLVKMLCDEYYQSRPGREYSLAALVNLLLVGIFRFAQVPERKVRARRAELDILRAYNELIEAHYKEQWPLAHYARELNITSGRLADICRRLSGHSPKTLIFERQIEEARWQLIYTTAAVSSIAFKLGFNDPAYFCRFFSKHTGQSPSLFRSKALGEIQSGYSER